MREIKFRAWDKRRKIMLCNHTFTTIAKCELYGNNDLLWMQYTGLKDKKGKDIYEGDFIQCPKYGSEENILERPSCLFIGLFEMIKNGEADKYFKGYTVDLILRHENGMYCTKYDDIPLLQFNEVGEIIGNIYKNKELLNDPIPT